MTDTPYVDRWQLGTNLIVSFMLALGTVGIAIVRGFSLWPFVQLKDSLVGVLHQGSLSLATELSFLATAAFYGAFAFFILQLSANLQVVRSLLWSWYGLFVIPFPFICWLLMLPALSPGLYVFLAFETIICLGSVYYMLRRETFRWPIIIVTLSHYGLWIWLIRREIPSPVGSLIPIVAGLSACSWMLCRRAGFVETTATDGTRLD